MNSGASTSTTPQQGGDINDFRTFPQLQRNSYVYWPLNTPNWVLHRFTFNGMVEINSGDWEKVRVSGTNRYEFRRWTRGDSSVPRGMSVFVPVDPINKHHFYGNRHDPPSARYPGNCQIADPSKYRAIPELGLFYDEIQPYEQIMKPECDNLTPALCGQVYHLIIYPTTALPTSYVDSNNKTIEDPGPKRTKDRWLDIYQTVQRLPCNLYAGAESFILPRRYENLDNACRQLYDILTYSHNYTLPPSLAFLANIIRTYMVLKANRSELLLKSPYISEYLYRVLIASEFVDVPYEEGSEYEGELQYESDILYHYRGIWLRKLQEAYGWEWMSAISQPEIHVLHNFRHKVDAKLVIKTELKTITDILQEYPEVSQVDKTKFRASYQFQLKVDQGSGGSLILSMSWELPDKLNPKEVLFPNGLHNMAIDSKVYGLQHLTLKRSKYPTKWSRFQRLIEWGESCPWLSPEVWLIYVKNAAYVACNVISMDVTLMSDGTLIVDEHS